MSLSELHITWKSTFFINVSEKIENVQKMNEERMTGVIKLITKIRKKDNKYYLCHYLKKNKIYYIYRRSMKDKV